MSAHQILISNGYKKVVSFGTSDCVRLPHAKGPREFQFETAYSEMHASMCVGGFTYWMSRSGISDILNRNANIKRAPSRWQDQTDSQAFEHAIAICYDGHVYDSVVADVQQRLSAYRLRVTEAFERASIAASKEAKSDSKPRVIVSRSTTPLSQRPSRANSTLDNWVISSSTGVSTRSSLVTPKQDKRSISVEVEEEPVNLDALAHHALQPEKIGSAEKTPSSVSTVSTVRNIRLIQSDSDNFTPSSSTSGSMSVGSLSGPEKSSKKSQKRSAFSSPESQKVILRSRMTQAAISGSVPEVRVDRGSFEDLSVDSDGDDGAGVDDNDILMELDDGGDEEMVQSDRPVQSGFRPSSTPSSLDEELHRSVRTMIFSEGAQKANPKGSSTVPVCPSTPLPIPVSASSSPLRRMASAPAIVAPSAHETTRPLVVLLLQTSDTIENAHQAAKQTLEFANSVKRALMQESRFADQSSSSSLRRTLSASTLLEIIEPAVSQLRAVADGVHARVIAAQLSSRQRLQAPPSLTSRIQVTGFDVPINP
jgi:hypothetical protein